MRHIVLLPDIPAWHPPEAEAIVCRAVGAVVQVSHLEEAQAEAEALGSSWSSGGGRHRSGWAPGGGQGRGRGRGRHMPCVPWFFTLESPWFKLVTWRRPRSRPRLP